MIEPAALLAEDDRLSPEAAARLAAAIAAREKASRPAGNGHRLEPAAAEPAALAEAQEALLGDVDPLRFMQGVLDQVLALLPQADGAAIELARPQGELLCASATGSLAPVTGEVHPVNGSPAGMALRRGVPVYEGDARARAGSVAYVPLLRGRERVGVLVTRAPVSGAFSPEDIATLTSLSRFVGVAVANALDLATAVEQLLADERRRNLGLAGDQGPARAGDFTGFVAAALGRGDVDEQRRRAEAARRVRRVLDAGSVVAEFQPIVDLRTQEVVGYEALARFPGAPSMPTTRWFADAAAAGLGAELELAAARAALAHLDRLPAAAYLAVNVSPAVAMEPGFADLLAGSAAERVVIELTEHAAVDDYGALRAALGRLREAGARIAIDDAGAGFASLRHVLRLAPELIKLDISLTHSIDADPVRQAMAGALIAFAEEVQTRIVAEGIENHWELDALVDLGVGLGQGFHLGRPRPLG